mgnify:CR=1 FL=1
MADTKQQWYKDAKYGLFIHWGLYSILAGEWKDPKTGESPRQTVSQSGSRTISTLTRKITES